MNTRNNPCHDHRTLDDDARQELRARAAEIVQSFLGPPNRRLSTRRQLRWGNRGSFALSLQGASAGLWFDHENGCGGDIISFLERQLGCSVGDAIVYALRYLGPAFGVTRQIPRQVHREETDDAVRIRRALQIWGGVLPLRGSLAERYLAHRGIIVLDEALDVLGFHPRCPFRGTTAPALVALIQDITTGEPVGVHRRQLTPDATAAGPPMSLGPKGGGVIRLSPAFSAALAIGEGVETCLAGMMLGSGATWSVLDAGGISDFTVLEHVQRLTILVDHDVSGTGQRAAAACRDRWIAAGKHVRLVMPDTPGQDINDLLLAEPGSSPEHA
ncbi:putative DNA primase/helicase [Bradyrhizobium sp. USDA 3397]